jgi:hypothetical protein
MKRIGLATAVGTLAMALLVPATVSAGSAPVFWSDVIKSSCTSTGGEHGFGKVRLGMRAYAQNDLPDAPTPNYIVIRSKFQQKVGGAWVTIGSTTATTQVHPDGHPYVFEDLLIEEYSFESADHPKMRMIMRAIAWDDLESGDVRLGVSARAQSPAC